MGVGVCVWVSALPVELSYGNFAERGGGKGRHGAKKGDGPRPISHTLLARYLKWVPFLQILLLLLLLLRLKNKLLWNGESGVRGPGGGAPGGHRGVYAVNPKGLGAEAKDNIFAQFSGVISIHAHAN